ncbi:uncharacterized protein MONBRDRAFT_27639 [Monosiga brevicollis MX1]|uniref:Amino acid transporter transmembrane domain-containing protein n=1 Tax=Monosiga brevicollis TaxID=81824 RepID=A9V5V9_MONBE|nr:uncharacterized protein MONBRDRAFT_27639 [Monosiga brevicollis MX1]EDQ87181.1 predicted protein [Monosiga brevicollis MX1]|eukprot:XP_001748124.1 hypothetical protein [Monosiga brevicollis MX1]
MAGAGDEAGGGMSAMQMLYCFFVSIATILGTGILALPVKLYETGFKPFMLTFTLTLVVQTATVFLMAEVLQRASLILQQRRSHDRDTKKLLPAAQGHQVAPAASASDDDEDNEGSASAAARRHKGTQNEDQADDIRVEVRDRSHPDDQPGAPSLHALATIYLDGLGARIFTGSAIVHFLSILVSYALAWSKAFCSMVNCQPTAVIAPFVIFFSTGIIIFNRQLQPLITALTFFKCVMLIVMVAVVGYVGSQTSTAPTADWAATGTPFLIGTLALGGVVNVMPVLYDGIPKSRLALNQFQWSVAAGVVACWVMNVLWAFFILQIVPQAGTGPCHQQSPGGNITLTCANDNDEISTQPIVDIMQRSYHHLLWLAQLVASFILLSIT